MSKTITSNEKQESAQQDGVNKVTDLTSAQLTGLDSSRARLEGSVREFVIESLHKDVPTGTTPARFERSYPRFLAATSPHEKIINRLDGIS